MGKFTHFPLLPDSCLLSSTSGAAAYVAGRPVLQSPIYWYRRQQWKQNSSGQAIQNASSICSYEGLRRAAALCNLSFSQSTHITRDSFDPKSHLTCIQLRCFGLQLLADDSGKAFIYLGHKRRDGCAHKPWETSFCCCKPLVYVVCFTGLNGFLMNRQKAKT